MEEEERGHGVEKERGDGGGGRSWRSREVLEEEGGHGEGERSWRRREAVEEEGNLHLLPISCIAG